jgi:RNA recognition motif-containing protein
MSNKLYVGNLAFQTTDSALRDLFSQHGTVTDVAIISDKMTGRSRGFGFVTMESSQAAQAAINALNDHNLDGRNLTVNEARSKTEGQSRY